MLTPTPLPLYLVNLPIIEAIMIGTKSGQGISFVSRGQVIEDHSE